MHIVIDAHLAVKQIDGVARYLNSLLSELPGIDDSISYTILALPPEQSSLPEHIFEYPNVERAELNLMGPAPKQHLIMRGLLKELKADLYHHPQFDLPLGISVPAVVTIHDLKYIFYPAFLQSRNWVKSFYIKSSLKHSIKAARRIIAVSQNTLADLRRFKSFDERKSAVIHHGMSPPSFLSNGKIEAVRKRLAIQNDFILFVGTRRPHKNIDGLVRALSVLRQKYALALDLVVAGKSYSDYQAPESLAKQLGLERHVRFLNFVADEDLPALYQSAKAVALVSFYEGFGFPLIEAMSYGTPVIGSNVSSIPEVIGKAGLLADPNDVEDIAAKLYRIVTEAELRNRLTEAGLARSKLFHWPEIARQTLDVYKKALEVE